MNPTSHPGLEIDEDLGFQKKAWKAQQLSFWLLIIILGGAVLGFFGPGLFSFSETQDAAGKLTAKYHRWLRSGSPGILFLEINSGSAPDGKAQVWLDRKYVEAIQIESTVPEPESVKSAEDRFIYEFNVADPARSAGVHFHFIPREAGALTGKAGIGDAPAVEIRQFVYP